MYDQIMAITVWGLQTLLNLSKLSKPPKPF